jgi:hypothetical protein
MKKENSLATRFLKHCFTGKDKETFDIARVLWALGILSFIAYAGWTVFHSRTFDPQAYGAGFGLIMASGGASVWAKAKTEPDPDRHELK